MDVEKALQNQLKNIESRTGKTLDQLYKLIEKSGLSKHGEIRDWLKQHHGMGHGDANTLTTFALKSKQPKVPAGADPVDTYYSGPKASLRPIHDAIMKRIHKLGDFDISPKKTYLSLRRKKQFAMVGPATNTRIEVGLNMKDVKATGRLSKLAPGGMCQYKVNVTDQNEVDDELLEWVKQAFEQSG